RRNSARPATRACRRRARCTWRTRCHRCCAAARPRSYSSDRAPAPPAERGVPAAARCAGAPRAPRRPWSPPAPRCARSDALRSREPRRRRGRWRARPSIRPARDAAGPRARAFWRVRGRAEPARSWSAPSRRRRASAPRPARPPASSQVFVVEQVQIPRELFERHLRVDLAAADAQRSRERGIALAAHGEGGGVALLAHAGEQVVVDAAIGVGEELHALAELALEQPRRLRELGLHALGVLRVGLAGRTPQVAMRLAVRLHVEALGGETLELLPRQR